MDVQQSEMDREALVEPMEAEDTRGLEVRVLLCSDVASAECSKGKIPEPSRKKTIMLRCTIQ